MTMNNDTKFEEEWTCQFKIDMRNLNFDRRTWKSQKFTQFRLLLTRVCNAWAKKSIEELCLMALKLMQNLKETGLCFLKFSFNGWKIVISFYKVKWQNSESRTYWFTLKIATMFPILTSRNRLMNTFIIVNITPTCSKRT